MFGILRRKRPIVMAHWMTPLLDFASDTGKFYDAVQAGLNERLVPELVSEPILFWEGGYLSAKRAYFRVRRELLVFDICSSPFGTSWWFSCRAAVIPRTLRVWELLVSLLAAASFSMLYLEIFGVLLGCIVIGLSLFMLVLIMFAARSWNGLDDFLIQLPVIGALYEYIFRADSYYRDDARRMYVHIVDYVVKQKVKEFAAAEGVSEVPFLDCPEPQTMISAWERTLQVWANFKAQQVS